MGGSPSVPQPLPEVRQVSRRQRSVRRPRGDDEIMHTSTLDEKFDAVRIEHASTTTLTEDDEGSSNRRIVDEDDQSHVSGGRAEDYVSALLEDSKNRLGLSALSIANPDEVLQRPSVAIRDTQTFNTAIPREGSPVTNQRKSGRCWIFAATNVFRIAIQQKYDIEKLELSQAYLFFWDKVEKANYFLESIRATADEDLDSRLIAQMLTAPVNDGGQWDMIVNLVEKYGIVPQTLYPDSWNAQNSAVMDRLLTTKLREDGLRLRKLLSNKKTRTADVTKAKDQMLREIVRIVTLCLGPPPRADEEFKWEFYNSKKEFKTVTMTPRELGATTHVKKFFSLTHDPRNPYDRLLTVAYLGNVYEGRPITYANVEGSVLKSACIAMLKKGLPVFFGSDVGKQSDSGKGIMDTDLVDYNLGFDVKLGMSKAERLLTGESQMTHAMVLTAVHLDRDGKPLRWRVENSWAETAGTQGYFVMSDEWMDQFCYQAVVDPAVVSYKVRDILKQDPKVLPLWDPMGALA